MCVWDKRGEGWGGKGNKRRGVRGRDEREVREERRRVGMRGWREEGGLREWRGLDEKDSRTHRLTDRGDGHVAEEIATTSKNKLKY